MSDERDYLLRQAMTVLQGARASCDAALVLLGAAMEPEQEEEPANPADTDRDPTPLWPASFGGHPIGRDVPPLTRERIRADLDSSRADATGAAFDPLTNTHAE